MIISGENIQLLCDVSIGYTCDFDSTMIKKSKNIRDFCLNKHKMYDNPPLVFCYGHRIPELSHYIHLFQNQCILISHNSDYCVCDDTISNRILSDKNIYLWYAQNIRHCFSTKLRFLPIGLANQKYEHGNQTIFHQIIIKKTNVVYFSFTINTNSQKRKICYDICLQKKITFIPLQPFHQYIASLSTYKYCICPEGNGIDTHRLWECYLLRVVPIVLHSDFIILIKQQTNLPLLIIKTWNDIPLLDLESLYSTFDFTKTKYYIDIVYLQKEINSELVLMQYIKPE
jgi:hypothetical protein